MFFFKQKTAYEMRISDWSSDVCSSDLLVRQHEDGRVVGHLCYLRQDDERWQQHPGHRSHRPNHAHHVLVQQLRVLCPPVVLVRDGKIGRASCRERVCQYVSISVVAVSLKKKKQSK